MEQERVKTKVNLKSHQLAYKKLERELVAAVSYVDYEDANVLTIT